MARAKSPKPSPHQSTLFESHRWLEQEYAQQKIHRIIGIDEAGRGPLAGPVVAAAATLPPDTWIPQLDDSKRLSEAQRDKLFDQVLDKADAVGVAVISAAEIDEINILQSTLKAMRLALVQLLRQLPEEPQLILIDGNQKFPFDGPLKTVVKGDHLSHNIAAASILAKVTRDRIMAAYHDLYPIYDFASHKGYASAKHRQAILDHGPCPIHRFSFKGVLPEEKEETPTENDESLLTDSTSDGT